MHKQTGKGTGSTKEMIWTCSVNSMYIAYDTHFHTQTELNCIVLKIFTDMEMFSLANFSNHLCRKVSGYMPVLPLNYCIA